MVCSNEPYCVYQSTPQCDCDWNLGICKEEASKKQVLQEVKLSLPSPPSSKTDLELNEEDTLLIRELIYNHKKTKKIIQNDGFVYTYAMHIHVGFTILSIFGVFSMSLFILKIKADMKRERDIESQKTQ
jgi:hypothetical protein